MTALFIVAAVSLALQGSCYSVWCLTIGLKEDSVFKMPEPNGNISFGDWEVGGEHNW